MAAVAAALGPQVALKRWSAPLLASHADDFRGGFRLGLAGSERMCMRAPAPRCAAFALVRRCAAFALVRRCAALHWSDPGAHPCTALQS